MLLEKSRLRYVLPAKPRLVDTPPTGAGWIHEVKFDGYRTQLHVEGGRARAFSSSGADWTIKYPQILEAAAHLACTSAIIDGEVYLPDSRGASDFAGLPSAIRWHPEQLIFVGFDLLHLDGVDTRPFPVEDRRDALQDLLAGSRLAFSHELDADGQAAFAAVEKLDLEGIVSKHRGSRYKSGDSDAWVKTKTFTEAEFEVIGADLSPTGAPIAILARRDEHGLHYVGDAFIALKAVEREAFWHFAETHAADEPSLPLKRRGTWLQPGLAARVKYLRGAGMLRHASLKALLITA